MSRRRLIESEADLADGIAFLRAADPRFRDIAAVTGLPPLRRAPGGFRGLLAIVTEQQISLSAAAAIWARMESRLHPFDPQVIAQADDELFRACGLSRPKMRALRAIGSAVAEGSLDFDRLEGLSDEEACAALTAVSGIGPWTASIYLLACMGRCDAWPGGDVALQTAAHRAFGLAARPSAGLMHEMAEPWRPWRSVAARLLWSYYRHIGGRQVPDVVPSRHKPQT